jgi:hypothetical protein
MGGNVFDSTAPIKKEHIKPTLLEFFKQFKQIFPKAEPFFREMKTLGSVGKKDYSGDIDLALAGSSFNNINDWGLDEKHVQDLFTGFKKRARTSTDDQLMKRAVIVSVAQKILDADTEIIADVKGSGAGALFLLFPQYDENNKAVGQNVQIDVNIGDVDWLEFAYYSNTYSGNVKGLHRTQLMLAMFSNKGYTFSHNYGVKDRDTQEIVANNPQQAIELLNKEYGLNLDKETLGDYFKLKKTLEAGLSPEELNRIYDIYLKILDSTRADIPEDLQSYWIENQERLGLKGKFLPDNSNLIKYQNL